ncbi:MAG: ABC transporter permease [Bryobacteraceae bacterium]
MSLWTRFRKRRALNQDLVDEIEFHRFMRSADSNPPPFGNPTVIREELHDMWTFRTIETLLQDSRYALRAMWREKAFSITSLLLLALAIGANSSMFTVLKQVILDPLPYPDSDRLVQLYDFQRENGQGFSVTMLNYLDWAAQTKTFAALAAYSGRGMSVGDGQQPELLVGLGVSANFFDLLRVQPALGRGFRPEENERGRDRVMVLSHALWQRKYGGDPAILGRTVPVNGESYQIVGVMPAGFEFPGKRYELWMPLALRGGEPAFSNRSAHYLRVIGRLQSSATYTSGAAEMNQIAANLERAYPENNRNLGVQLRPLKEAMIGDSRGIVFLLYGAVTLLLLVACASLAALQVARAAKRKLEFTTRAALGASRLRLAAQVAVESSLLGALGGALALALAYVLLHLARTKGSELLPRLEELHLDATVVLFSFLLAMGSALLFGMAPFAQISRLAEGARGSAGKGIRLQTRSVLVVAQVALAFLLLAAAGLFVRSLDKLGRVDKGFSAEGVVTLSLVLQPADYKSTDRMLAFARQLSERLDSLPGGGAGGFSTTLPLTGQGWGNPIAIAEKPSEAGAQPTIARIQCVSAGYLQSLATPLRAGRLFSKDDHARSAPVAVVDESFVREFLPDVGNPVGKRIKIGDANSQTEPWRTIVGVVGSSRQFSLEGPPEPHVYVSYLQLADLAPIVGRGLYLAARSSNPAHTLTVMKKQVAEVDPTLAIRDARYLSDYVDTALALPRARTFLMTGFAGLALLLAGTGLYGVVAFTVASRRQEFGVRIALGATPANVVAMILQEGARLTAVGLAIGILSALALSTFLDKQQLLFDLSPTDTATYILAALLLSTVTLLASYLPGRRAAAADPMKVLRTE